MTTEAHAGMARSIETDPESLIVDIVTNIAAKRGVHPRELPPLCEYVDVDSLVRLVETACRDDAKSVMTQFEYDDHGVRVQSDGANGLVLLFSRARKGVDSQ